MPHDPFCLLDLEFALYHLCGASKALGALLGASKTIDCTPAELGALVDLITEKAQHVQKIAGFGEAA